MKTRRFLWIILVAILAVGGIVLYRSQFSTSATSQSQASKSLFWLTDYDQALKRAEEDNKLIAVDFFATWCPPCKMMDERTFAKPEVQNALQSFVPLKIDVDKEQELAARYGIESLPTTAVLNAEGKPITGAIGYQDAKSFLGMLRQASEKAPSTPTTGIIGQTAPELGVDTWYNLPDDTSSVDVSDYRGKVVYLYGFQSWCPAAIRLAFRHSRR